MLQIDKKVIILLIILFILPFVTTRFIIHLTIMALIYAIIASNWSYVMNRGGIFSLAQVSFFAIGGYISGILAKEFLISPFIGIILGGLGGLVTGVAIGLLLYRIRGMYVALITIAFQQMFSIYIHSQGSDAITGGRQGLMFIPSISLPGLQGIVSRYLIILVIFLISTIVLYRMEKGFITTALVASRDDELLAKSRGLNTFSYSLKAFAFTSFFIGTAGGFYAHYLQTVDPSILEFSFMIPILAMMVVGGTKKYYGPILGAFLIIFLDNYVLSSLIPGLQDYRLLILPVILILVIILLPSGLLSLEKLKDYFSTGES